ncbi:hypothetical protein CH352_07640 [Leptospira hartskeerlii]|uniref:Right handed beta helix domain-containing protein n=1 Tax=Leptospira hartskeerlii TaxID=2023177 RepID=A0A2M9XFH5_9LEPT|nr:hypothetical protein [Leptospira hartskeerlii]PJZ26433.1 hypothetical protein CH357_08045 [Leptospira hartskeerlii]PJZ34518.1 hypothetical protein CH352_07640 [Leptospira hartskeerlii]
MKYYSYRILFFLLVLFANITCYKPPQASTLLDFFSLKTDLDAFNTPIKVFAQVSGLSSGTLTISNQLGETLAFPSNGTQQFPKFSRLGKEYSVSIIGISGASSQQECKISNPEGPIVYPKTVIFISCGKIFYDLSVKVIGLDPSIAGTSPLVLQNMSDKITFNSDGTKTFAHKVGDSANYSISFISTPIGHSCSFIPNGSENGTMSGAPLTLLLDCISILEIFPKSKILTPNGKVSVKLSFHGVDPGSCSFDPITISGKNNVASLGNPPSITYPSAPDDHTIVITPNSPDKWGPPGSSFFELVGCTAKSLPIQNGNPIHYDFITSSNIRLVDESNGIDDPGCGTGFGPSAFCRSIEKGVQECDSSGSICSVFVSEGSYTPISQIFLGGTTSLFGGFASGFPDLDSDPSIHPTRIVDDTLSSCGTSFANFCNAILISTTSLSSPTTNLSVIGFQIQMNLIGDYSTGIQVLNSRTNLGQIIISKNMVFGNETNSNGFGIRTGLLINQSDNVVVTENWLRGGSGRSHSIGAMLEGAGAISQPIILSRNILDGLVSIEPAGFSAGLWIETGNFEGVIVSENKINAYQYLNPGLVSETSYGIIFTDAADSSNIINNDIYIGNSQNTSLGKSTGIFVQAGFGIHKILNNQIFSQNLSANTAGINFATPPDASSIIRGNNYFVSVPLVIGFDQYIFCGIELNQEDCAHPISGQFIGDYSNSYGADPKFADTIEIEKIWNFNLPFGIPTSANSPCSSLYGGVDLSTITLPITAIPFIQTDFYGSLRTNTSSPFTPSGAGAISIGAVESDANCF